MELFFLITLLLSSAGMGAIVILKLPVLAKQPERASSQIRLKEAFFGLVGTIKSTKPLRSFSGQMFLQKVLSKSRVLLLKVDNKTFHWLQTLREKSQKKKFGENDNYWQEVRGAGRSTQKKRKEDSSS